MKRLIAILAHPLLFCRVVMDRERMVLFHCACILVGVENPTIWDLDRITETFNKVLHEIYLHPGCFDSTEMVKRQLFWTLLILRFKDVELDRDDVRRCLYLYDNAAMFLKKDKVTVEDAMAAHCIMVSDFENFV